MALIACEDLTLGYEGRALVRGLTFSVEAGDSLCVVGENGAGKSTLMRTLLGLQPPMGGRILRELAPNEIGYLPQQTAVQRDFPASVREIVLSGCQGRLGLRPFYRREDRRLAAETMEKLGLTDLAGRCYRELSGGQQQRVLLCRALCATRKLLLLDEPAAGLDPLVTAELYRLIRDLNRRDGVGILMISHDLDAALRDARHILHIGHGGAYFYGTKEAYLQSGFGFPVSEGRPADGSEQNRTQETKTDSGTCLRRGRGSRESVTAHTDRKGDGYGQPVE